MSKVLKSRINFPCYFQKCNNLSSIFFQSFLKSGFHHLLTSATSANKLLTLMLGSASSWFHGQGLNPCLVMAIITMKKWSVKMSCVLCHVTFWKSIWPSTHYNSIKVQILPRVFSTANIIARLTLNFLQFFIISRKFLSDYYIAGNNIADPKSFLLILWDYSVHLNQMITRSTRSKITCFNADNLRCPPSHRPPKILNGKIGCPCHMSHSHSQRSHSLHVVIYQKVYQLHTLFHCYYLTTQSGPITSCGVATVASAQMIWWLSPNLITHLWLRGSAESAPGPAPAPAEDQESSQAPAGGTAVELATNFRKYFAITEKTPPRAFSCLKAPASTFTFKTLFRPIKDTIKTLC